MSNVSKLRLVAAAAAACAAMAVSGPANAFVYATSALQIENLNLTLTGASATVSSFTFNLNNSASMNGPAVVASAACNSFGAPPCSVISPVLDAGAVNAPGSSLLRANNTFGFLGTNQVDSYSNADSVIATAALVQGVPTSTRQVAESLLNTNGFAAANALVQSNTSIIQTLDIGSSGGVLDLTFNADPDQSSEISGLPGSYLSQSDLNASFTLALAGGGSVSWSPNGTGANDCTVIGLVGVTCIETADTQDLNFNTSTGSNPGLHTNSFEAASVLSAFGIRISGLQAGSYTIALNGNTSTSIIRRVPEPATTGLIGIALAGLGLTAMRRKRKQG